MYKRNHIFLLIHYSFKRMVSRLLSSIADENERKQLESILTEEEKQNPNLEILEDDEIPVSPDDYCTVSTFHASQIAKPDFKGGIDEYGVAHIYPIDTSVKNKPVFVDLVKNKDFNTKFTNVSFGHGSHLKNEVKTENGVIYSTTTGSPITYNSKQPPGRSIRWDFEDDGDIWGDESKCKSWRDKPDFLCSPDGFRSSEFTVYVRFHKKLGTHMSCCAKGMGRRGGKDDAGRSVVEMGYVEDKHTKVYANANYDHEPYVPIKDIQQFFDGDKLEDNKWIGLKWCFKVPKDKSYLTIEEYVDLDPFDTTDGKKNNNWKMKAILKEFKGVKEYNNIISTWIPKLIYLRADGWGSGDIAHGSSYVPINWEGDIPPTPDPQPPTPPVPPVVDPPVDPKPPAPDVSALYIQIIENIIAALSPEVAAKVKDALKAYLEVNDNL